jgi:drug/metabolite transporter (DMT)-like permease
MMLVGSVLLHAVSLVRRETIPTAWPLEAVAAIGYLAIVSGAVGYLVYLVLVDALGPVEVSLLQYVVPLFAALVGWFTLGEVLSATTVAGFCLIVVGFVLVKREALRTALRRWQVRRERSRTNNR